MISARFQKTEIRAALFQREHLHQLPLNEAGVSP